MTSRLTRPPLLEPCPKCGGAAVPLAAHLVAEHGYGIGRARYLAARIANRERLSVVDSERLGIRLPAAGTQHSLPRVPQRLADLPTDAQLTAALRKAGLA
jgi:hypothetical protein